MGARKLYEEKILELIKNIPEKELPQVVSLIERIKEEQIKKYLAAIKEGRGKYKGALSPLEEFMKRKQEEKLLDR
ncbi:MAG: hypothetical protein WKG06_44055 [Segetibacter sp.]